VKARCGGPTKNRMNTLRQIKVQRRAWKVRATMACLLLTVFSLSSLTSMGCGPGKSGPKQATAPRGSAEPGRQSDQPLQSKSEDKQLQSQSEYESWYNSPPAPWQPDKNLSSTNQVSLKEGLVVTTAIVSDVGDYESIKTVVRVSADGEVLYASANVPHEPSPWYKDDPPFRRGHVVRAVSAKNLQHSTGYDKDFTPGDDREGAPSISFSSDLLASLKSGKETLAVWACGDFELQCARDSRLKRTEPYPVPFPVLLQGQRVNLPAVHARCKIPWNLTDSHGDKDEHGQYVTTKLPPYLPCDFWILDNPDNPLVLAWQMQTSPVLVAWAVSHGAPRTPPENLQVIKVDYLPQGSLSGSAGTPGAPQGPMSGPIDIGCAKKASTALEYAQRCIKDATSDARPTASQPPPRPGDDAQAKQIEQQLARKEPVQIYGIYFDFGSATIRPESELVLNEIADILKKNPDWVLSVDGHTDNVGGAAFNQTLSEQRAAAVKDALVTRYHIEPNRLLTHGYGLTRPVESNDTPAGRARNRRVELVRQ
jgi:outer membrane protein OmpA-like peptidoglycan-associated protein